MIELYTQAETDALRRRVRTATGISCATLAVGMIVCIALCCSVTTRYALTLQWTTVAVSTLAGWVPILLLCLVIIPCRVAAQHASWMLTGERESVCGTLSLDPARIQIPNSIAICKVHVTDDVDETTLNLYEAKVRHLPPRGQRVRVWTVRRYIVAWEACDEKA